MDKTLEIFKVSATPFICDDDCPFGTWLEVKSLNADKLLIRMCHLTMVVSITADMFPCVSDTEYELSSDWNRTLSESRQLHTGQTTYQNDQCHEYC